jgi:hypothetical protein
MPVRAKRDAAAPLSSKVVRATKASDGGQGGHGSGVTDGQATKQRPAATAEAIEREVRIAYEARQRPPVPPPDAEGDSPLLCNWLRDEAAAMNELASRLVPTGWTWAIQMEFLPPGVRLVLDGPRRGRNRR